MTPLPLNGARTLREVRGFVFMIVILTFAWSRFRVMPEIPEPDAVFIQQLFLH